MKNKDRQNNIHSNQTPEPDIELEKDTPETEDDVELIETEVQAQDEIKKIKQKLKDCNQEKQLIQDNLQRAKAEFLNAKKRLEAEKELSNERILNQCLTSLLSMCDSFEMAKNDDGVWNSVDDNWRKGIEGIEMQLKSILDTYSVEKVGLNIGDLFDPSKHEAVGIEKTEDLDKKNTVSKIIQAGYIRKRHDGSNDLLRPVRVIVVDVDTE